MRAADVYRGVLVVKPRQPYADWANSCQGEAEPMSLEELREDSSVYLVPPWDTLDGVEEVVACLARDIFENELAAWSLDESTWPRVRDAATFQEWFEVESHSVVLDFGDGGIEVEGE